MAEKISRKREYTFQQAQQAVSMDISRLEKELDSFQKMFADDPDLAAVKQGDKDAQARIRSNPFYHDGNRVNHGIRELIVVLALMIASKSGTEPSSVKLSAETAEAIRKDIYDTARFNLENQYSQGRVSLHQLDGHYVLSFTPNGYKPPEPNAAEKKK